MNFILQPWQLLHLILAGWVNHQQQLAIDYLRTENQILREKFGKGRILLDDDQRRRLAVPRCDSGQPLGELAHDRHLVNVGATMDKPLHLFARRGQDARVIVAGIHYGDA
jgi:hypothetical protein